MSISFIHDSWNKEKQFVEGNQRTSDFKILSLISFTNTMIIIIIIVSLVDVNFDHIDFEIVPLMDGHIVCQ